MVIYNTKEEAKAVLRNRNLPFGSSIILNSKEGDLLGIQTEKEIKFLDMNTLPPSNGKTNQVLKLDENGNVVWADDEMRDIVDNLNSTDTDKALSANMGNYLQDNKFDNDFINNIPLISTVTFVQESGKLNASFTKYTYTKENNSFGSTSYKLEIPLATASANGVLSVDHFKLLTSIVTNASTITNGIVHAFTAPTYTATTVSLNSSILYKNASNAWATTSNNKSISAATTTNAGVMSAADKVKLNSAVINTTSATKDTLGLVKQAADLTDLGADADLAGVIAQFNQLLANLKAAGIMYQTV